jgi:hypothetical protein
MPPTASAASSPAPMSRSITAEAKSRRKPARDTDFRLVVGAALSPVRKPDGYLDREKILEHVGNLVTEHVDVHRCVHCPRTHRRRG